LEKRRPLRRPPFDHNFGSLLMLAVTAGPFLPVTWGCKGALFTASRVSNSLKTDWQRHVLASSGYLELGMFDAASLVLEEARRKAILNT
jgi:hypothetical protein